MKLEDRIIIQSKTILWRHHLGPSSVNRQEGTPSFDDNLNHIKAEDSTYYLLDSTYVTYLRIPKVSGEAMAYFFESHTNHDNQ